MIVSGFRSLLRETVSSFGCTPPLHLLFLVTAIKMNKSVSATEMMLSLVKRCPCKLRFQARVSSSGEHREWLTLSQDTDVILISLASNSLNFLSPYSPPQLNIIFPLTLLIGAIHLFSSRLKLWGVMHFSASFQHFPNSNCWPAQDVWWQFDYRVS